MKRLNGLVVFLCMVAVSACIEEERHETHSYHTQDLYPGVPDCTPEQKRAIHRVENPSEEGGFARDKIDPEKSFGQLPDESTDQFQVAYDHFSSLKKEADLVPPACLISSYWKFDRSSNFIFNSSYKRIVERLDYYRARLHLGLALHLLRMETGIRFRIGHTYYRPERPDVLDFFYGRQWEKSNRSITMIEGIAHVIEFKKHIALISTSDPYFENRLQEYGRKLADLTAFVEASPELLSSNKPFWDEYEARIWNDGGDRERQHREQQERERQERERQEQQRRWQEHQERQNRERQEKERREQDGLDPEAREQARQKRERQEQERRDEEVQRQMQENRLRLKADELRRRGIYDPRAHFKAEICRALGIPAASSDQDIKKAYRNAQLRAHPDRVAARFTPGTPEYDAAIQQGNENSKLLNELKDNYKDFGGDL